MASPPYSVHLHPGDALDLVKEGASLLILDMPPNTLFGFDLQMLSVGPRFKGLKMIPPGPHFVYYSATSKHGGEAESSHITGFFVHLRPSDVLVRRWDAREELLVKLSDSDEEERLRHAVSRLEFDPFLGPYDIHNYQSWKRLTGFIGPPVIEQFEPVGGNISVVAEADFDEKRCTTAAERRLLEHLAKGREAHAKKFGQAQGNAQQESDGRDVAGRCFYTKLPHLVKRTGASAAELTMLNVDKTAALESLLNHQYKGSEDMLLGELQFAFIAFLMGQSLESFSQWKSIVCLLLSCNEGPLHKYTRLFVKFLEVICFQLQFSLKGARSSSDMPFLDDSRFVEDNFLHLLLKEFYQLVMEATPVDGDLLKLTRRLKSIVESLLGWNLGYDEGDYPSNDEYAPVILTEEEVDAYMNRE